MKKLIIIFFVLLKINISFTQNIENINVFEYIDKNYNEPLPISGHYKNDFVIYFNTNYNDKNKLKSENPYGNLKVFLFYKYGSLALEDTAKKRFPDKLEFNFHRKAVVEQIFSNNDIIKISDFDIYIQLFKKEELVKVKYPVNENNKKNSHYPEYYYISQIPCTKYYYYKKVGEKKFIPVKKYVFVNNITDFNTSYSEWLKEVSEKNNEEYFKLKNR